MLKVYAKNEKELAIILGNMKDCRVVVETPETPSAELIKVEGTCSACPHFTSRKSADDRGRYVNWGYCSKVGANTNERKNICSIRRREVEGENNHECDFKRVSA